ncbi:hypothetical protein EMIT0196MI5_10080 [Pseudomonas sp. IT-196MI5]
MKSNCDTIDAFASKPALERTTPVGASFARDEAITFNSDVDCQTAIASRLALTGISVKLKR